MSESNVIVPPSAILAAAPPLPPLSPRPVPPAEQLAAALYEEHSKKRFPSALPYPWEHLCAHQPAERNAWIAVAEMAILNLCS